MSEKNRVSEANGAQASARSSALLARRSEHIEANRAEGERLAVVESQIRALRRERESLRQMRAARSAAVGEINLMLGQESKA